MKDLAHWNRERHQHWADMRLKVQHPERFGNGFKCPLCVYGELYDTGGVVSQSPTVLRVKCQQCIFKGERYE